MARDPSSNAPRRRDPPDIDGEVVLTRTDGGPNLADLLGRSPRWVHTVGTGVDSFPFDALQGQNSPAHAASAAN